MPSQTPSTGSDMVVLILAPTGRDAEHTADFVTHSGLRSLICRDMADLCHKIAFGCGALVIAEEALSTSVAMLVQALAGQPSWSDVPILLITSGGEATRTRMRRLQVFGPAGNVMLIERPFRPDTLVSALEVAMRSRRRQYQVRDLLEERARTAERLEQLVADRTAALQDTIAQLEGFSYSITHDMRGPLRAITSFAHLLRLEHSSALSEEAQDYLRRIVESTRRLDQLIQDVLQYSRLGRHEMPLERIDVPRLLNTILADYPNLQEHRQHITVDCAAPAVRANPAALSQCLSNLLVNAIKFVAPGQTPSVHVSCTSDEQHVRIVVQDNGIGISPQHHERIFGAFQRLHHTAAYEGTGIGLAIVKRAVERMQGRVGVESEPNRGSRFWIELPRA